MQWIYEESVGYTEALHRMDRYVCKVLQTDEPIVWVLSHPSVYTYGLSAEREDITLPAPLVRVHRGGSITYHGPGQMVVYVFMPLKYFNNDLHRYVRFLEQSIIDFCALFNRKAFRIYGKTGVYTQEGKIGFIGVSARKWISYHGIAINIDACVKTFFQYIRPCGLDVDVSYLDQKSLSSCVKKYQQSFTSLYATVCTKQKRL